MEKSISEIDASVLVQESARRYHESQREAFFQRDGTEVPPWSDLDEEHRLGITKVAYSFIAPVINLIYDDVVSNVTNRAFEDMMRGVDIKVDLTPDQPYDILKSVVVKHISPSSLEID